MSSIPSDEEIADRVRATLRAVLGEALDAVADTDELRERLGDRFDSLRAVECVTRVEGEFGIEVDFVGHDVRYEFATVERIVRFVRWQLDDLRTLEGTTAHGD